MDSTKSSSRGSSKSKTPTNSKGDAMKHSSNGVKLPANSNTNVKKQSGGAEKMPNGRTATAPAHVNGTTVGSPAMTGVAAASLKNHSNGQYQVQAGTITSDPKSTVAKWVDEVKAPDWKGPTQDVGTTSVDGDPFKKPFKGNHGHKLSGGATSFTPAPIEYLNRNSTADVDQPVIVSSSSAADPTTNEIHDKGKNKAVQEPIGTRGPNSSPSSGRVSFTTDAAPRGHYIKIVDVPSKELDSTLGAIYHIYQWDVKVRGCHAPAPSNGSKLTTIFICFDSVHDAKAAFDQIQAVNTTWNAVYITQPEYAGTKFNGTEDATSLHDGQVLIIASFHGLPADFSTGGLAIAIQELAEDFGEVIAMAEVGCQSGSKEFRVEFSKISAAKGFLHTLAKGSLSMRSWSVTVMELPDWTMQVAQRGNPSGLNNGVATTPHKTRILNDASTPVFSSPTGRSAWRVNGQGKATAVTPLKQLPKCQGAPAGVSLVAAPQHRESEPMPQTPGLQGMYMFTPRSQSWTPGNVHSPMTPRHMNDNIFEQESEQASGPNFVDGDRILNGHDVRTTLMLRNLPNDMNVWELKQVIDTTAKGKYDFSYLRIDYHKSTNVGYGFVNFVDPREIVNFVQRWVDREWLPGRRRKYGKGGNNKRIADVSYATIQGIDCLIEKFRNSSVLDEFPDYRPKLWWTYESASSIDQVGTERTFPEPNNMSKKQRSRDNAAHVGIYDRSNRGQNSGRQHRSQYDRGTPAQQHEEMMFHQMTPMQNAYPYGHGAGLNYPEGNFMLQESAMVTPAPYNVPAFAQGNGAAPGYNGHPYYNANPALSPPGSLGYGMPQFSDPFAPANGGYNGYTGYGGYAGNIHYGQPGPSMTASSSRNARPSGVSTRRSNVATMRDPETARRQVAEDKAKYPEAFGDYVPQGSPTHSVQSRRNGNRNANINIPKAIVEETEMADNFEYTGRSVNSPYPANGYGHTFHQQY